MRKKLFLSIFLFTLTIGLSGCYVPFLKKEITIPFFEKKPEKAISLMMDKMSDLKTVKYKTNIAVKMRMDPSKMENSPLSFLNNGAKPKVLGKSVSAFDDMGILPIPDNNMNMPILGDGPTDFKYNIFLSGASDNRDKNNLKNETEFDFNFDIGGMAMSVKGETKVVDKKIYFKINQLPILVAPMFGEFSNKWYELDIEELQEFQKQKMEKAGVETDSESFDFEKNSKKIKELAKKINKLIKDNELISVDKRLKDEKIDNKKCYHYQTSVNKNNLDKFIKGFIKIIGQTFIEEKIDNEKFDEVINNPKFNSFINNLYEIIQTTKIEFWIDKKDFYLRKSKFNFQLDFAKIEVNKQKMPKDFANVEISGDLLYSDFNKPLNIVPPVDPKSLIEEIKLEMGKIGQVIFKQPGIPKKDFIDTDNDGLTDEEEKFYGTSIISPDTDGDGYSDYDEIQNNYNPLGQGKLNQNNN
ncbi:MAG: hypothetical protein U9O55_04195 [Patescibacteria group bacterium]|nr:hypothetical protein [Patescibacteria group bacterium]